eukprot:gi/632979255/ref/XP_007906369.1/ PREDICTED: synaptopodin [Callorhinchus milii]
MQEGQSEGAQHRASQREPHTQPSSQRAERSASTFSQGSTEQLDPDTATETRSKNAKLSATLIPQGPQLGPRGPQQLDELTLSGVREPAANGGKVTEIGELEPELGVGSLEPGWRVGGSLEANLPYFESRGAREMESQAGADTGTDKDGLTAGDQEPRGAGEEVTEPEAEETPVKPARTALEVHLTPAPSGRAYIDLQWEGPEASSVTPRNKSPKPLPVSPNTVPQPSAPTYPSPPPLSRLPPPPTLAQLPSQARKTNILEDSKVRRAGKKPMFTFFEKPKVTPNPELLSLVLGLDERKRREEPGPGVGLGLEEEEYLSLGAEAASLAQPSEPGSGPYQAPEWLSCLKPSEARAQLQSGASQALAERTGRGAELFARRQSRMEKYVIESAPVRETPARSPSPTMSLPPSWKCSELPRRASATGWLTGPKSSRGGFRTQPAAFTAPPRPPPQAPPRWDGSPHQLNPSLFILSPKKSPTASLPKAAPPAPKVIMAEEPPPTRPPPPLRQASLPAPQPQASLPAPKPQASLAAPQSQASLPGTFIQAALPGPLRQVSFFSTINEASLPAPLTQAALPTPQPQVSFSHQASLFPPQPQALYTSTNNQGSFPPPHTGLAPSPHTGLAPSPSRRPRSLPLTHGLAPSPSRRPRSPPPSHRPRSLLPSHRPRSPPPAEPPPPHPG